MRLNDSMTWAEVHAIMKQRLAAALAVQGIEIRTDSIEIPEDEVCPVCGGVGWIKADLSHLPIVERLNHPAYGKPFACTNAKCKAGNEARERREQARLKGSGLPPEYNTLTFETWNGMSDDRKAGKWIGAWAAHLLARDGKVSLYEIDRALGGGKLRGIKTRLGLPEEANMYDERHMVILYGAPNMGKTGIAAACVNMRRAIGKQALYIRCLDMLESIHNRFGQTDYPTAEDLVNEYKSTLPFMVIDEAGIKGGTGWKFDQFDTIVRGRAAHHKPTLLTTNLTPAEFEQSWGTQAFAILNRQGFWIPMLGKPIRAEMSFQAPLQLGDNDI